MLKSLLVSCLLSTVSASVAGSHQEWQLDADLDPSQPSDRLWSNVLAKRDTAFPQSADHSEAFEVVHVIAAVVGIVGAMAIGITIFFMFRRRNSRRQKNLDELPMTDNSACHASAIYSSVGALPPVFVQGNANHKSTSSRFDQFASAFCHEEQTQRVVTTDNNGTILPANHQQEPLQQHPPSIGAQESLGPNIIMYPPPPYRP